MSTKFITRPFCHSKMFWIYFSNRKKIIVEGLQTSWTELQSVFSLSFTLVTLFSSPPSLSPKQRLPYHLSYFDIFRGIQNFFFDQNKKKMAGDHKMSSSHNYPIEHKSKKFIILLSITQRIKQHLTICQTKWSSYDDHFMAHTSLH